MHKFLSKYEINHYQKNGAIVVRDIFRTWIDLLRTGFEKVLNEPGPHARENTKNNEFGGGGSRRRSLQAPGSENRYF